MTGTNDTNTNTNTNTNTSTGWFNLLGFQVGNNTHTWTTLGLLVAVVVLSAILFFKERSSSFI